jgi:signal transduction histidine kinase
MGDGTLRLVASFGSREVDDVGFARFPAGHGLVGLAASNRQLICCRDVTRDPLFVNKAWAVEEQIISCVLVPLVYSERLHGVLAIFTRAPHDFSDEEIGLLRSFGDQAAIAMENARLFEQAATVEALRELARLKTEFLSTVSHELRTPLTLIYGYTELLVNRAHCLSSSQVVDMAAEIHTSTRVMVRMVDDLLDFSRLEQGSLHLQPREVVVSDLLYRLVDTFRRQPGGERIVSQLPDHLVATLDPDRLSQVVTNLLSNALRYATSGPIIVRAAQREDRFRVEVADRGPGIRPEEQPRIWESFYRGADMLTKPVRGSGLGLAVVKHLVELHGGTVGVNSTLGEGATFWLTLPIKERANAA